MSIEQVQSHPEANLDPKDDARFQYMKRQHGTQDHGVKGTNRYKEYDYLRDQYPTVSPMDIQEMAKDDWTPSDQESEDANAFMAELHADDRQFWEMVDDLHQEEQGGEPFSYLNAPLHLVRAEPFEHIESRQQLAEDLLWKLEKGKITKAQAWDTFEANTAPYDFDDRSLAEQESDELRGHFEHSGRMAVARTLENNPLEDVDYLDGFSIRSW